VLLTEFPLLKKLKILKIFSLHPMPLETLSNSTNTHNIPSSLKEFMVFYVIPSFSRVIKDPHDPDGSWWPSTFSTESPF
jgi:hypothetical protein